MIKSDVGTELFPLPQNLQSEPPLCENEIKRLFDTGLAVEKFYNLPQDIEWTFVGDELVILQARPISTDVASDPMDKRPWYLSLHRSLENLQDLWLKIENDLLPAMSHEADELHQVDLQNISDMQLADEIEKRKTISEKWTGVYWQDFIPFAHGMRLFGQVYNDTVKPHNPYEFVELLVHAPLQSIERNTMMLDLAKKVRENDALRIQLENDSTDDFVDNGFALLLEKFVSRYGDFSCSLGLEDHCRFELKTLVAMILEMASHPLQTAQDFKPDIEFLEKKYFQGFSQEKRAEAEAILKLGRASYRLRDDDNIYLGRIELELARALEETHQRLERSGKITKGAQSDTHECLLALRDHTYIPPIKQRTEDTTVELETPLKARQLVGQPAGPGMVQGKARVVNGLTDLGQIKKGEVLICDAIEPNMTFVIPLAAAIVERRGGMLIHGAIIAREYGIPCVTGIVDATRLIHSGDRVNVDGYLGIVTIMNAER
jgi:pyruvate,water dikinase